MAFFSLFCFQTPCDGGLFRSLSGNRFGNPRVQRDQETLSGADRRAAKDSFRRAEIEPSISRGPQKSEESHHGSQRSSDRPIMVDSFSYKFTNLNGKAV